MEFFYDEEADGIEAVGSDRASSAVRFRVNGRNIDISGMQAGALVGLYTLDGVAVATANAAADGRASIGVPASGIYVLKAGDASFKIRTP
ncbi:MAG: hypothetical protein IJ767_03400 [Bacteroidaceae bacterium]|nr:hypothetical protein [Bacteroidaceae bacterium]